MSTAVGTLRTIRTQIPARLDRLPWSRFHWRVVAGLGTVWILDGLEVKPRQDDNPRRAFPTCDLRLLERNSRARGYGLAALGRPGFDHGFNHFPAHS
jgi:hypothetical protein